MNLEIRIEMICDYQSPRVDLHLNAPLPSESQR